MAHEITNGGLSYSDIFKPTPVQKAVIPRLLSKENVVMAASTGSGKTLAYALPTIQSLQTQESAGYHRTTKRPRCLVLVPTRELARQVLSSVKSMGHFSKVSSTGVVGGEDYAKQKKSVRLGINNCYGTYYVLLLLNFIIIYSA